MTSLRVLVSRLLDFFVKGRRERRLEEEISFHLELLAEENRKRGMSEHEARAAARRSFGGVEQVKEVYRDRRGVPFVENLVQDLRFAFRLLKKERGFTVAAVLALTLGIGASNAVFTIVNVMVLRGLPHDEPDRIVKVRMRSETGSLPRVSYRDVQDWDAASNAFTHIAAFKNAFMTFGAEGRAEGRYRSTYVDAGTFGLLGEAPLLGRDFLPEDDRPGAAPVVILGHRVWTTHYEADPGVLGRTIEVDGTEATIIGVMKEDFRFPDFAELWQPLARLPDLDTDARDARTLRVVARLANDAERSSAQRQLDTVAGHLRETYPETNAGLTPRIEPFIGSATDFALFPALLGAVAFVLLIACANVANLLLARSATRSREIAVRAALGGTRWRILRQLMVESLVLAFTGAILGLGFSVLTLRLFARTIEGINLPYWLQWTMDERVVVFLVLATTTSVFAFGLVPALHLSRARLSTFIKEGRASRSPRTWMGALAWIVPLFAAPTMFVALRLLPKYAVLEHIALEQFAVNPTWSDKLFFIGYSMTAVGFITVLVWEAAFPDRRDAAILGALPIGGGSVLAAKLTALCGLILGFATVINVGPAVLFSFAVGGYSGTSLTFLRYLFAHVTTTIAAGLFVFFVLMATQTTLIFLLPRRALRLAMVLAQLIFVVALVLWFALSPYVLERVDMSATWMPPLWLLGLYETLLGAEDTALRALAVTTGIATLGALALAIAGYAASYARIVSRSLAPEPPTRGSSRFMRLAFATLVRHPIEQAVFEFVAKSLARSRRHRLILAIYIDVGLAFILGGLLETIARRAELDVVRFRALDRTSVDPVRVVVLRARSPSRCLRRPHGARLELAVPDDGIE